MIETIIALLLLFIGLVCHEPMVLIASSIYALAVNLRYVGKGEL